MSTDRLEQLLEHARPPEPADDGFTEIVMQSIRARKPSRPSRGRFVTRPAVLAAAAVLATGGALAAAVRTTTNLTNQAKSTARPATAKPASGIGALDPAATSKATPGRTTVASPAAAASRTPAANVARSFHNSKYQWGYTNSHTSFVLDKRTGLKIVIDTRGVSVAAGHAHDVVVTVINTSTSPMGISSQNGCAVSAAAWHGAPGDASASPAACRDPAKASVWKCPDGTDAHSGAGEEFLLGPGGVRRDTISLKLPGGDWSVAAACRCDVVTAIDPGGDMTLHGVDGVFNASGGMSGLVTPPVGVKSR